MKPIFESGQKYLKSRPMEWNDIVNEQYQELIWRYSNLGTMPKISSIYHLVTYLFEKAITKVNLNEVG